MTTDILDAIDDTLEDWYGSDDSMRWRPRQFPWLTARQEDVVRRLSADTGMDGYAAWLAVADVVAYERGSPHWELVRPAIVEAQKQSALSVGAPRLYVAVDMSGFIRGMQQLSLALGELGRSVAAAMKPTGLAIKRMVHDLDAQTYPRAHIRCRTCHPCANPGKLPINGHEYHRRQRARQRRGR